MTAAVRHCPKHNLNYKGRCPKCRARHGSSRPVGRRGRSAIVLERLPRIEQPQHEDAPLVTTATFFRRALDSAGIPSYADLPDDEFLHLISRSSRLADRWLRLFGAADRASAAPVESNAS